MYVKYWCYCLILKLELLGSILLAIKYKIYFPPFKQNITGGCRNFLGILILIPRLGRTLVVAMVIDLILIHSIFNKYIEARPCGL